MSYLLFFFTLVFLSRDPSLDASLRCGPFGVCAVSSRTPPHCRQGLKKKLDFVHPKRSHKNESRTSSVRSEVAKKEIELHQPGAKSQKGKLDFIYWCKVMKKKARLRPPRTKLRKGSWTLFTWSEVTIKGSWTSSARRKVARQEARLHSP